MASTRDVGVRAGDGIVVRTPLLPLTLLGEWTAAPDARRYLAAVLDRPEVREAIHVASPSMTAAIESWRTAPTSATGARVEQSLAKYVARMMGRATPFGLFSAVSAGTLGPRTELALAPRSEYRRRTRLDNDYLFVLIGELVKLPDIRGRLVYRPNSSIYRNAGRLRYAAAQITDTTRSYHLIAVEITDYLDASITRARSGATREELATPLVGEDISLDEARAYIDELIDAQVVVPDLGIHVTGPEPIDGLLEQLRAAGIGGPAQILDDVRARITELDAHGLGNSTERYRAIADLLTAMPAKVDASRLFQVDMVKPAAAVLGTRTAREVGKAIGTLAKLTRSRNSFDEFKRAFLDRWEGRVVPLVEVLDEESGIGFEVSRGPGAEGSPLLAGLPFPAAPSQGTTSWMRAEHHLLKRLASALAGGAHEITLDADDVTAMQAATPAVLPDAFGAAIRIAATADELSRGESTILLENASGPSGARLLGRFCHASPAIDAMVRAHHALEEALRPDAIFAEIVHLNEGRVGNILCRPVLRTHEIVYLGVSGAAGDDQIQIDDLLVTVRGDRIVLSSRRLGREIIPRLTTAHNFQRGLGVYRFLCGLANQDCQMVGWSWGVLGTAPFLPRVRLGNVIFSRAMWNLDAKELEPITTSVRAANKEREKRGAIEPTRVLEAVAALRQARRLPRMLAISSGDNELPIDLDNPLLAAAFADELSGSTEARLVELFPMPDQLVVQGPEGGFTNEIVVTFTREPDKTPARATASRVQPITPAIQRTHAPGSNWLFAKIYCGESTADRVLCDVVGPVARSALANGDAHQWFFIRYRDPEPHLRVRFAGDPARLAGGVLPELARVIAPLVASGTVRTWMLDTYARETERYGGDRGIELVEKLFWHDSEAVLGIVELLDGDAGRVARWKLALRGIESLLEAIGISREVREKVAANGKESLGRELRADTNLWAKIGERFTRERSELEVMFDRDPVRDSGHELEPGFELLARRDAALVEIGAALRELDDAGSLTPRLDDIAWSLVHMHANRLLHASQRAQEMVLYDFLRRLHAARRARSR